MVLISVSSLQLVWSPTEWTSYALSYIIVRRRPSSCECHSTRTRSRLYSDIPRPDSPVIYTGAFPILTAWTGSICYMSTSNKTITPHRRTRHAGHCWRSKDELVSDVLLWTPAYDQSKAGRPAQTYIQQLCDDTVCYPEDLSETMNDWEMWRERIRDIRAGRTTWWWWWWWYIYIYIYRYITRRGSPCTHKHAHTHTHTHIYIYIYICLCKY